MDLAEQTRLQTQAFEAINEVVRSSATDVVPMVVQLIPLMISKLQETCNAQPHSAEAAERQSEIQVGGWQGSWGDRWAWHVASTGSWWRRLGRELASLATHWLAVADEGFAQGAAYLGLCVCAMFNDVAAAPGAGPVFLGGA